MAGKQWLNILSRALVKSEDVCKEDECSLHKEKLKLFCLDHQELVCLVCRDAGIHFGHRFRPLEEVVEYAKEKLQDNDCQKNCDEQAENIKIQRENFERKIKKDFEDLRRFLDVEEEARLAAVREEETKKNQTMKEKMAALGEQTAALSDVISSAEEMLMSSKVSFMKKFKNVMSIIQEPHKTSQLLPGGLLDEAKHVGNLKFKVWERM
ncbi:E3 ubiquitin-protein ligase TRIM35-like [Corythoichthys intestinalis]|uniref:E3 ubiquitin-protein ligase TRIM35-like n=1 Tax=Corythoichthys intestinalis TaxID=161448 RepID=UPI0025A58389|nr:E3 ubiquitin-protein ligase TRIM35-like [Corythoichthys intestinalis]XP_057705206.1 E3 ubiquitin-protein ligase TRIM35-like [Corythoichthys intestinalis]